MKQVEHDICSEKILQEYQQQKELVSSKNFVICQHIGSFSQNILTSIITLTERSLIHQGEPINLQKKLTYLIIEIVQNIIYHSVKFKDENHLAYIVITKSKQGYTISSSNALDKKSIKTIETKIDNLLAIKPTALSKSYIKKIQSPTIDQDGNGGIGLLTLINKSGKGFKYNITSISTNYSLFHIELKIKPKKNGKH